MKMENEKQQAGDSESSRPEASAASPPSSFFSDIFSVEQRTIGSPSDISSFGYDSLSPTAQLCESILNLLREIGREISCREDIKRSVRLSIEQSRSIMVLWSEGYGISDGKLDHVFETSRTVRRATLGCLSSLTELLLDRLLPLLQLSPEQVLDGLQLQLKAAHHYAVEHNHLDSGDSDSLSVVSFDASSDSFEEVMEDFKTDVECLMELGPLFKDPASHDFSKDPASHEFFKDSDSHSFLRDARRPYRMARPRRAPRRLTTREEANFKCEVEGCGKLFSRSYNFKAHMETHDNQREYPFPCQAFDCSKKFVRKTDLQRHQQSVHMKERSHKCDYCSRLFARKDTLRRHMEEGCSKRFDIETLYSRSDDYNSRNLAITYEVDSQAQKPLPGVGFQEVARRDAR